MYDHICLFATQVIQYYPNSDLHKYLGPWKCLVLDGLYRLFLLDNKCLQHVLPAKTLSVDSNLIGQFFQRITHWMHSRGETQSG